MHLDPFGLHVGVGANDGLEAFTGQDSVTSDLDRGNGYDVVGTHVEPVVSQSIATTSSAGPRLNMNRYD